MHSVLPAEIGDTILSVTAKNGYKCCQIVGIKFLLAPNMPGKDVCTCQGHLERPCKRHTEQLPPTIIARMNTPSDPLLLLFSKMTSSFLVYVSSYYYCHWKAFVRTDVVVVCGTAVMIVVRCYRRPLRSGCRCYCCVFLSNRSNCGAAAGPATRLLRA